jgi:hypothetical protein
MNFSTRKKRNSKNIIIVCFGETEKYFLENLKEFNKNHNSNDGKYIKEIIDYECDSKLGEAVENVKKKHPFEKIYFFTDGDMKNQEQNLKKLDKLDDKIRIFFKPCFEIWYLLHYEDLEKQTFNACGEVIKKISDHDKFYKKPAKDYFEKIKEYLEVALERSKNETHTNIYKLFEDIKNVPQH